MKCPCLYGEEAPICRADTEAMRIPVAEHLARFCSTEQYRRCDVFRAFVQTLTIRSKRPRHLGQGGAAERPTRTD